jgi:hypothetical protein
MQFCPIKQYKGLQGVNKQVKKGLFVNRHKNEHLPRRVLFALLVLSTILTFNICIVQPSQQDLNQPIRVRIFTLRNITAQQAKDYLAISKIADTVLAIPGTTAISVTGSPQQLVYASNIVKLVDSAKKFDVQMLDIQPGQVLPAAETIEVKLGREYSVGSLLEGPASDAVIKAMVCLHMDKLLIIAPQEQTQKITEIVLGMLAEEQDKTEPNQSQETKTAEDTNEPNAASSQTESKTVEETPEPVLAPLEKGTDSNGTSESVVKDGGVDPVRNFKRVANKSEDNIKSSQATDISNGMEKQSSIKEQDSLTGFTPLEKKADSNGVYKSVAGDNEKKPTSSQIPGGESSLTGFTQEPVVIEANEIQGRTAV